MHLEILRENPFSKIRYYGQDISLEAHNIGQFIEFILSGHSQNILIGDSLKKPGFLDKKGELKKFDYAISVPPFSLNIDKELIVSDKFDRFKYMSEKNSTIKSDWIVAQHMLSSVKSNGKAAVLLPLGVLFRMGQEANIRKAILQEDLIEAVIKLPENLFQYSSIGSCWIIFNKKKPENKRNKIQFIDLTSYLIYVDRRTKGISQEGISAVIDLFNKFEKGPNSLILSVDELAKRDYTLNAFDFIETERIYEKMNQKLIPLKEVAIIRRGVQVTKTKLDSLSVAENKTHYMVSLGNIGPEGNIIVDDIDLIHAENRWVDLYEAREGDILVTSRGNLFKLAIVKNKQEKYIVSSNLFIIRLDQSKYKPELLKFFLESDTGQKLIESIYKGSVITSITNSDLENLLIPEIPIEKQQLLVNLLTSSQTEYLENMKAAKSRYESQIQEVNKIVFSK